MADASRTSAATAPDLAGFGRRLPLLLPIALILGWLGVGALLEKPQNIALGLALLLGCGVAAALSLPVRSDDPRASAAGNLRERTLTTLALACFVAGLLATGISFVLFGRQPLNSALMLATWLLGITLFLLAAWFHGSAAVRRLWMRPSRAEWASLAIVGGLTLAGLVLRATNLDGLPMNMHGDEGDMGLIAREIANGAPRNPFGTGWLAFPNLWFFMQAMSLRMFGDNESGLRMVSAIVGALAIPATYWLGRTAFSRAAGLAAAALLTVYHFDIQFSRLAVNNIGDPLFMALALAGFMHGFRHNKPLGFAVSGVSLGLLQHFYVSGRIAPIVLAIMIVHQLIVNRRQLWRARAGLLVLLVGFIVGIGPLALHYAQQPGDLTNRISTVNIFGSGYVADLQARGVALQTILLEQLRLGLGAYVFEPDHGSWYAPGVPLLDRLSAVLLLVGLGGAMRRWRAVDATMWPAWLLGVALAGGTLTTNAPEVQRYVAAAPALCVLIALAVVGVADMASDALPRYSAAARSLVMAALLGSLVIFNVTFYFRDYAARSYRVGMGSAEETTAMGEYLAQFGSDTFAYLLGSVRDGPVRFLAPQVRMGELRETVQTDNKLPNPPANTGQWIFVVLPPRAGEIETLQRRFPGGAIDRVRAPSDNRVLFSAYRVRP